MLARLRKAREEEGFTLIELLVVMIIIGILAAIAIPLFLSQRKNAVDASIKSDLRTLANTAESVYTDSQAYPASLTLAAGSQTAQFQDSTPANVGDPVRTSKNNAFGYVLAKNSDAFCIEGKNAGATHAWVYASNAGGLQASTVTACTSVKDPSGTAYGAVTYVGP